MFAVCIVQQPIQLRFSDANRVLIRTHMTSQFLHNRRCRPVDKLRCTSMEQSSYFLVLHNFLHTISSLTPVLAGFFLTPSSHKTNALRLKLRGHPFCAEWFCNGCPRVSHLYCTSREGLFQHPVNIILDLHLLSIKTFGIQSYSCLCVPR
jgi:hypothetical protein